MLDKNVKSLINEQINKEFYSAYLYLDFSNYYYDEGLDGFANWYEVQAQEERDHAMLMRSYLHDNGGSVSFDIYFLIVVLLSFAQLRFTQSQERA